MAPYVRKDHLAPLIGVVLEEADKARLTNKPFPSCFVLNPVGLGYPEEKEIRITAADEPYLPEILHWAAPATAHMQVEIAKLDVHLRSPYVFAGRGAYSGTGRHSSPGTPHGGSQCVAVLPNEKGPDGKKPRRISVDLRYAVLDTAPGGLWWAGITEHLGFFFSPRFLVRGTHA